MLLSLLVVLALIFVLAAALRKLNTRMQRGGGMQVLSSLSLGQKERLLVVQVGDDKLLLGVTPHAVQLLKTLPEDFAIKAVSTEQQSLPFTEQLKQQLKKKRS
ncbi:flagellar biosynthetic protein FliO [Idiomarina xiamenensis]|nr:flagellar biosynthetic protein FliO [Idiomarina xiamenensis]